MPSVTQGAMLLGLFAPGRVFQGNKLLVKDKTKSETPTRNKIKDHRGKSVTWLALMRLATLWDIDDMKLCFCFF